MEIYISLDVSNVEGHELGIEVMESAQSEPINRQTNSHLLFQDQEALLLDVVIGRLENGPQWNEADDLGASDGHSELARILARLLVGHVNRRHVVIGQIERDLGDAGLVEPPADALDGPETARLRRAPALLAQIERDAVRLLFRAQHVHVVRDEEFAHARRTGAPTAHELGRAEIWAPLFFR